MQRLSISALSPQSESPVKIAGFVERIRDQGKIKFIVLRDRTGYVQLVVKSNSPVFNQISDLTRESVVEVVGTIHVEPQAPGGFEVIPHTLKILAKSAPELPIPIVYEKSGGEADAVKRLDHRWLDLRRLERQQIFHVWTALEEGFRSFLLANDFIQLYSPSFMSAPSESGAEVFEVDYFGRTAYLAQSPQFYKQMAMSAGFERVFMVGPVFRAEKSFTTRHMTEFTGWDFELSYIDSPEDVMATLESALISAFETVRARVLPDVPVPEAPFPKIPMSEVKVILAELGVPSKEAYDVSPEEERALGKYVKEKYGSDFVFITDWHISARPFYHMRYEDHPELTKSFDLIYKGVEVSTGAQREHRIDLLEAQATEKGLSHKSLKDYLDFFRYGCPPHGGVGIGPGRLVMGLLDLPSVKEATYLPRDVKRLRP